ncbi:MAG: hypothetical protein ACFFDT_18530 [Candidatus Hodarchaeota archaeon]
MKTFPDSNVLPRFARLLRNSEPESVHNLVQEMINFRISRCKNECESKKVVCILRPLCPDRRFLDILISVDHPKKGLPLFCYGQRIKEIARILKQSDLTFPPDIQIYLSDFLNLILEKKKRKKELFIENIQQSPFIGAVKGGNRFIVAAIKSRGVLTIIDRKIEVVVINPIHWKLESTKILETIIDVFEEEFQFTVEMERELGNFLTFTFMFPDIDFNRKIAIEGIQRSNFLIGFTKHNLIAEIITPEFPFTVLLEEEDHISVGDIRQMFLEVKAIVESQEESSPG